MCHTVSWKFWVSISEAIDACSKIHILFPFVHVILLESAICSSRFSLLKEKYSCSALLTKKVQFIFFI